MYHDGRCCTNTGLSYHLADDWLFSSDGDSWRSVAEKRRRERAATPIRDARAVFYGRPMLEFVARETFAAFARRDEIAAAARAVGRGCAEHTSRTNPTAHSTRWMPRRLTDEEIAPKTWSGQERYVSPFYDTLKQSHAGPVADTAKTWARCPREIALNGRDQLELDLQDRCQQWSLLDESPRGLEESSHAFRYGGSGTNELVMYYDLVREFSGLAGNSSPNGRGPPRPEWLTVGDFLSTEIPRLERIRDAWLDTPDREFHSRTPRSIINRERAACPKACPDTTRWWTPTAPAAK